MADCSKTIEYAIEKERLCKSMVTCYRCPISLKKSEDKTCWHITQNRIDALQKWSDEHPVKTRKTVFLETYPNAELKPSGIPYIYPCILNTTRKATCGRLFGSAWCEKCAKDYWDEVIE